MTEFESEMMASYSVTTGRVTVVCVCVTIGRVTVVCVTTGRVTVVCVCQASVTIR